MRGHGRLHWMHWAILAGSVAITGVAWHLSRSLLEERSARRFEREASDVVALVQERLRHYEDALLSGVAMIRSRDGKIAREDWRRYARHLRLPERYPGISGIGVIHRVEPDELAGFVRRVRTENPDFEVHPEHPFGVHLPITYIEPEAPNAAAVGLDVAFEPNRRTAALRAMRSGTTQVSGPIVLVQDSGRTPGFLIYAPYRLGPGSAPDAPPGAEAAGSRFGGFVYAPLIVRTLIAGTLDQANRDVLLSIRDGDTVLHEEADEADGSGGRAARLAFERDVAVYGRTWRFDLRATAGFDADSGSRQPLVVLLCGLVIDALLLVLFWLMSRSNRRVLGLAERTTDGLAAQAASLAEANDKLASFAHVASHDLKTPLRGVMDLAGFLEEDLADYFDADGANPEVRRSLDGIRREAGRGAALVDGILEYSVADAAEQAQALVDSRALVEEILEPTPLSRDRVELHGDFPVFRTHAVRFGQVLRNLVGNAVKYHGDPANARLRIGVSSAGGYYRFEVEDDGPGIEPRFHERIFEAFTRLDAHGDVDGSGIGLSIVRKSVESLGGTVTVSSAPGAGSTFGFDWPATIPVNPTTGT